jgi:hypothetical protein
MRARGNSPTSYGRTLANRTVANVLPKSGQLGVRRVTMGLTVERCAMCGVALGQSTAAGWGRG